MVLLATFSLCSAVIDKRTGKKVQDLDSVIEAIYCEYNFIFDPIHPLCPVLENYEFTFNEKHHISFANTNLTKDTCPVSMRKALEKAANEDDFERSILAPEMTEIFYENITSYYLFYRNFHSFELEKYFDSRFKNEIILANETLKVCLNPEDFHEKVKMIIENPVRGKLHLVEDQNWLVTKIMYALKIEHYSEKRAALHSLIPIKYKISLIESLASLPANNISEVLILNVLSKFEIIDLSVRNQDEFDFEREPIEDVEALTGKIISLKKLYKHVLHLLEHSTIKDVEFLNKVLIWGNSTIFEIQFIKKVLLLNEEERIKYIKSLQGTKIIQIKNSFDRRQLIDAIGHNFLTSYAIQELFDTQLVCRIFGESLSVEKIKEILEKHSILEPAEEGDEVYYQEVVNQDHDNVSEVLNVLEYENDELKDSNS